MRNKPLILATLALFLALPAAAQETAPGAACTAGELNRIMEVGGPETSGVRHTLRCNGTTWQQILTVTASGRAGIATSDPKAPLHVNGEAIIGKTTLTCSANENGALRYGSGDDPPWVYCNGSAWVPFKPPQCANDATGECILAASRSGGDPDFTAANIICGVNILGITGSYGAPSTTGLVGHWKLDNGSGTIATDSTGGSNGTLTNGPTWTAGRIAGGVNFDGTNDYVNIPMTTALNITTNTASLSAWFRADSTTGLRRIVSAPVDEPSGTEKFALLINDGTLQYYSNDAWYSVSAAFSDTTGWHHVVGTYNGTTARLYLDGVQVASGPDSGNILATTAGALQIGRYGPNWGQYFDGRIDDVRIYNRALSAANVTELYNAGIAGCS